MKAGVAIFDAQTGKMRSIVDITSDFAKATEEMTDKERQRLVTVAYGARGMLAFNAIQKAAFTTMQDGTQVTLEGAEAIAAMRKEMRAAEGTAEGFRDKLLDTFEGQKTLLKGTMQTFAVVLGEPFAAVFKPIVKGIVNTLNTLLRMFKALPKPIKEAFAGFITAAGAVMALVGAVIALKGAFKLLGVAAKAMGLSFGGLDEASGLAQPREVSPTSSATGISSGDGPSASSPRSAASSSGAVPSTSASTRGRSSWSMSTFRALLPS